MIQIQKPYITLQKVIKQQKSADGTCYRLLTYCIEQPVEDGWLLFNTMTCEMVFLSAEEHDNMFSNEYLIQHWFVVPTSFDDRKFKQQSFKILSLIQKHTDFIDNFTIFTTTDCNARCFYCFQKGIPHHFMSLETADKIVDILKQQYFSKLKEMGRNVLLQWFGGEPLYNSKVITHICQRLKEEDIPYRSAMITNGYLFTPEMAKEANELWHMKKLQITLDGTEEVYNKVKNYIYKEGSAFQRVLDNIDALLDNNIRVTVRLNLDRYNADNLMELADVLGQRFSGRVGFSCYGRALFEQPDKAFTQRTDEQRTLVYDHVKKLREKLLSYRIARYAMLPQRPRQVFCKADSGNAITILPDGNVGICDFYTDSHFVSHIDHLEQRDKAVEKLFHEHCEDLDICSDCPLYTLCIRLKMCGEENNCFPQLKQQRIESVHEAMTLKYKKWKKTQTVEPSLPDGEAQTEESCI